MANQIWLASGPCVAEAGLKHYIKLRMTLNLWSFFLYLLGSGIKGVLATGPSVGSAENGT